MSNRKWMYNRHMGNKVSSAYMQKVDEFITFACGKDEVVIDRLMKCPCAKYRNRPYRDPEIVQFHLYTNGFCDNYYHWTYHGDGEECNVFTTATKESTSSGIVSSPYRDMVIDAFGPEYNTEHVIEGYQDVEEEDPLPKSKKFFDMLKAAEEPLYEGCNMNLLSVVVRVTNIKCEFSIPHTAVDSFSLLIK